MNIKLTACYFNFLIDDKFYLVLINTDNRDYTIYLNDIAHPLIEGVVAKGTLFTADLAKSLLIKYLNH